MENEILTKYAFDIPGTLIKDQVEGQTEAIMLELQEKNLDNNLLEAETKKIKQEVASRLSRDYRLYFLAQQVAHDYKIEITQEDLTQELMRQMWLQQSGQSIISKDMESQEVRSRLYAHILVNKAIDYLITHAQKRLDQQDI